MIQVPPPGFLADPALAAVLRAIPSARLVGGCVRDAMIGAPVADIDLATPERPEAVLAALRGAGLGAVPTGLAHGTVTAVSGGRGFQITTLRRDVGTDGRHATVAWTTDWAEDAARRDFTFNALSMTAAGALFDPFDGLADLRAGRVRFVGAPAARLAEDWLRALRYFRFFALYGALLPDAETRAALRAAAGQMGRLSAERVWSELKRLLGAPDPRRAVALMEELGVLAAVLPEAGSASGLDRLVAAEVEAARVVNGDPLLRLAALLGPGAASPAGRLRLSGAEAKRLAEFRHGPVPGASDSDAALLGLLCEAEAEVLIGRVWLSGGGAGVRARIAGLTRPEFPLGGRDALALGLAAGPAVGAVLEEVRRWWAEGGFAADRAACLAHLARLVGRGSA